MLPASQYGSVALLSGVLSPGDSTVECELCVYRQEKEKSRR
jgi:hypothetical protein